MYQILVQSFHKVIFIASAKCAFIACRKLNHSCYYIILMSSKNENALIDNDESKVAYFLVVHCFVTSRFI